jgi:hypothetical protein
MTENTGIKFVGFSDALSDATDHLSNRMEKTLDLADTMYVTHGQNAVDAAQGYTDRDIAQHYAAEFVSDQLEDDE